MKRALFFALALALLGAGAVFAQSPAAAPQPQTLEQLRLSIFQAGPAEAAGEGDDSLATLSPEAQAANRCTGNFCAQLLCECAEECQPCGIARFNCVALLCACKQC